MQTSKATRIKIIILCAVLLVIYVVLGCVSKVLVNSLSDQHLSERWSDERSMGQVSIYITEDQMVKEDDIKRFMYELEKKLVESGVSADEDEDETGKDAQPKIIETIDIDKMNSNTEEEKIPQKTALQEMFAVSYCAQGQVTMTFENRTADKAQAIGVGGDFFLFHPMTFVSGTGFSGDDLMKDRIVLDEDMAWQLFGSIDIVGQSVLINDVPHYVVGVVAKDQGRLSKAAGLSDSFVYMSYDSLSKYGTILSGLTSDIEISEIGAMAKEGGINCIEVVCPNPVKGLAAKICKESLAIDDRFISVIDNTERFSFFSIMGVLGSFGVRSMWNKAIYYPYWENIARGFEDILAVILLIRLVCLAVLIAIAVVAIVQAYRHKTWTVRSVMRYLADKKYDLEVEYRRKKL